MASPQALARGYQANHVTSRSSYYQPPEAVFVMTRENGLQLQTGVGDNSAVAGRAVRRPFGLEFKKDTYAYIEVLRADGDSGLVPLMIFNENQPTVVDSRIAASGGGVRRLNPVFDRMGNQSGLAPYANNFLITRAQEVREEKFQVIETFGDTFVYFFGERPRFMDVSGVLANANSHRWKREWWLNYDRFLRGTRAIENRAIVTLHIDGVAVSGYILSSSSQDDAENPRLLRFDFKMLVTDYVFEDAPFDTLNYFAENLYANNPEEQDLAGRINTVDDVLRYLSDSLQTGMGAIGSVTGSPITQAILSSVSQAAFGNPLAAITDGIAMGANFADKILSSGVQLGDLDPFRDSLGSLVEFNGKPVGLYPVDSLGGKTTLQQIGNDALMSSIDNSVSILLNLSRSPIVQAVAAINGVVDKALSALGLGSTKRGGSRGNYDEFVNQASSSNSRGQVLSGRFMGYDLVVPFRGFADAMQVNPQKATFVASPLQATGDTPAQISAGAFGPPDLFGFSTIGAQQGSGIRFDLLKQDPNYLDLPRVWRLQIEKEPQAMSDKIIVTSRPNSEDDLVIILRRARTGIAVESRASRTLEQYLGA